MHRDGPLHRLSLPSKLPKRGKRHQASIQCSISEPLLQTTVSRCIRGNRTIIESTERTDKLKPEIKHCLALLTKTLLFRLLKPLIVTTEISISDQYSCCWPQWHFVIFFHFLRAKRSQLIQQKLIRQEIVCVLIKLYQSPGRIFIH